MSQQKIDQRKKSKGDLLHSTKVRMRNATIIISIILILLGAFASVVCYNNAYDKGKKAGYQEAVDSFFSSNDDEAKTGEDESESESSEDESKDESESESGEGETESSKTE